MTKLKRCLNNTKIKYESKKIQMYEFMVKSQAADGSGWESANIITDNESKFLSEITMKDLKLRL